MADWGFKIYLKVYQVVQLPFAIYTGIWLSIISAASETTVAWHGNMAYCWPELTDGKLPYFWLLITFSLTEKMQIVEGYSQFRKKSQKHSLLSHLFAILNNK